MRKILLSMLLAVVLAGVVKGQEMTRRTTEEIKTDPVAGMWKLNSEKSTFASDCPAPRERLWLSRIKRAF
jgi:hypothetical protein